MENLIFKIRYKSSMIKPILVMSVILLLFFNGCSPVNPPILPDGEVIQTIDIPANYDHEFTKIILTPEGSEYDSSRKIILWDKAPAVWIGSNASQDYINKAKEVVGKLAQFTDYVIIPYITENKQSADITFEWVDNLEDLPFGGVANASITEVNSKYVIKKAKILFWNGLKAYMVEGGCIEELTHALGPCGETEMYPDSVFAINPTIKEYNLQDLAAGKVIYQLEPGTTFEEFDKIVEESLKTYSILN